MNLQERLTQCRKDKAAIEQQEMVILKQIKIEKEKIPTFANVAKIVSDLNGRLILYLTPEFVENVNKHAGGIVAFDRYGNRTCRTQTNNASTGVSVSKNALMSNYSGKPQMIFKQ